MVQITILWMLYSFFEGMREGFYWHYKSGSNTYNEHFMWTIQRAIVLIMCCMYSEWYFVFIAALMFPFLHDGMYYTTRNVLSRGVYPRKWLDQSTTSTAISTKYFTPKTRTLCFLLGILLIFII